MVSFVDDQTTNESIISWFIVSSAYQIIDVVLLSVTNLEEIPKGYNKMGYQIIVDSGLNDVQP